MLFIESKYKSFIATALGKRTCPILRWKVTPQILLKDVASVQPHNFFPPHKMFKFILILGPALEAHYIALSSLVTSSMYMFMMSYCIVWPDVWRKVGNSGTLSWCDVNGLWTQEYSSQKQAPLTQCKQGRYMHTNTLSSTFSTTVTLLSLAVRFWTKLQEKSVLRWLWLKASVVSER